MEALITSLSWKP